MLTRIINLDNILQRHLPISIHIQLLAICSLDQRKSKVIDVASNRSHKLIIADLPIAVSVKCFLKQVSLVLVDLNSKVIQPPSEIVDVEWAVVVEVDFTEDFADSSKAEGRSRVDLLFDFFKESFDLEALIVWLINAIVSCIRSGDDFPDVLIVLEFRRNVSSDLSCEFQSEVLGFVKGLVWVNSDFVFSAVWVFIFDEVSCEEMAGWAVFD